MIPGLLRPTHPVLIGYLADAFGALYDAAHGVNGIEIDCSRN